jgi:hypothetical protein
MREQFRIFPRYDSTPLITLQIFTVLHEIVAQIKSAGKLCASQLTALLT